MWTRIAHFIIKYRLFLIIALTIATVFMGYKGRQIQISYEFAKLVPPGDSDLAYFERFKNTFGEDANVFVIGADDKSIYKKEHFNRLKKLTDSISDMEGVQNIMALPQLRYIKKDTANRRFVLHPLFKDTLHTQSQLDSLLNFAWGLKYYKGQLFNEQYGASNIIITIKKDILNSAKRNDVITDIITVFDDFEQSTGIVFHKAGLPYVRSIMTTKVMDEFKLFLVLAVIVTALILLAFFRSFLTILFPMIIVGILIVWTIGIMSILGYKVTLITGLIPPIIVVISIPNCIYLINKFQKEYREHGYKMLALSTIVRKIGVVTLITNTTTSIGFLVYAFTGIDFLKEFGILAGIMIFVTFTVCIILIPAFYTYSAGPSEKALRHHDSKVFNGLIDFFHQASFAHRKWVYIIAAIITLTALVGIYKIKVVSYMVDDLPQNSDVRGDLAFFESRYDGVMPFEVVINTHKKNAARDLGVLRKADSLQQYLAAQHAISQPVSVVSLVKAATQAFYNNDPEFYRLPYSREKDFIYTYLKNQKEHSDMLGSFVDSTGKELRLSCKIKDLGTIETTKLINDKIEPHINEMFADTPYDVHLTGTTLIYIKGNRYLINSLYLSISLAFGIIAVIMGLLFRSLRIVLMSFIPNIIPLLITGGIMGYFGIPIKPSTALIFSIAFGIAVDDTIHFLARYRQELFTYRFNVFKAVSIGIRETGSSMIYTSIVLFCGFVIFAFSDFGGTKAMGILTSISLLFAMVTNLTVLPSLLLSFDSGKYSSQVSSLMEHYDEFHMEEDDDELNLDLLDLKWKRQEMY